MTTIRDLISDDKSYAWRHVYSLDGDPAPFPIMGRLLALTEDAERIVAFEAESVMETDSTWRVTWLLPRAIAHVEVRRKDAPVWAAGRSKEDDRDSDMDTVAAAWLRPLASIASVEVTDPRVVATSQFEQPTWKAALRVNFADGTSFTLPRPTERRSLNVPDLTLSPIAAQLRTYVLTGALGPE